ncbi:hypothetical protein E5288_WYG022800 [Bos mutus]|uniref:Uncharacterized protein n=1 Tax=Bos mutus TaxID=72004 RepID=A0A6B0QYB7_9CETA|nr:hypothetical protein [Bos mutus]
MGKVHREPSRGPANGHSLSLQSWDLYNTEELRKYGKYRCSVVIVACPLIVGSAGFAWVGRMNLKSAAIKH